MDGQRPRRGARTRRWRGFARTIVVGIVSTTLAVGTTLALASVDAGADAGARPNGNAVAQASVLRIAPGVGSLALATTTGTSLAHVANQLAEAQAQAVDLGLIGSALTAEKCDGSPGAFTPDQLPQPIVVDNRKGDATMTKDEAPIGQSALGGGRKEVSADATPASHAAVTNIVGAVGNTLTLSGGRSDATATVDPGKGREADATVSVDIDIAGVVQLHNAQWHAFHRTGDDPSQGGTFSVASTTVGGIPVPIDQLGPLQDAINQALALTGISIVLPTVRHITSPTDFVQVTPLEIKLDDTPVGKAALGPALNASRVQREQLINQLLQVSCQLAGGALIADIGLDIVSGTGFAIIDIGGATVSSGEVDYQNPFGDAPPLLGVPGVGALEEVATPPVAAAPRTVTAPAAGTTQHATPIAQSGPLQTICETLSPAKRPGCSKGMAVPLALFAIALTTGVAYLDWRHQRKALAVADEEPIG